jgi:hypothetical protein
MIVQSHYKNPFEKTSTGFYKKIEKKKRFLLGEKNDFSISRFGAFLARRIRKTKKKNIYI